ncbi:helix-turn-helix domain-containing protein [Cytobacillus sp. FJAT-54145]|uniref:Helix-turn-helix domain-containing protein n=1 Tax=Cytobacillus spartinae TaxID=3299023 RepID=A0ABW6KFX9_9BACI
MMDFSAVGKKIKELRKEIGLSQGELANGICTQAQISKIESGDVYPYASTLYLISERLGVDVNYFFDIGLTPRLDYVQEVAKQLRIARRSMNYQEMKEIVEMEQKNPLFFQNKRNYQLLLWHKGIYEHAMNRNIEKAIGILQEAIALTQATEKFYSERELELMLSIGVIYFEENDLENALATYKSALDAIRQIPYLNEISIQTRIYYNIARVLTRLKKYDESIKYCKEGIDWCIKRESLYLLGELHYHKGYNYELQGSLSCAQQLLEKARLIFELQNDERFLKFIDGKIEKLRANVG